MSGGGGGKKLLTLEEVADLLGRAPQTLYHWRCKGVGPTSLRLRGRVVYQRKDVERWVRQETGAKDFTL